MVSFMSAQDKEIWPMMGYDPPPNDPLFSYNVQLETRVRKDHPLRKIKERVDFDFIYREVEKTYGTNGNVSVPPPVVLKLLLLLILYNVRSERELMETLPERLDWLWFLGFTIESSIPDHSVLSKARRRWGEEVFKHFFERIVVQCVNAGLVDGTKIFMDSSLIDADASNNSVMDTHSLARYLKERYRELETRLDEKETQPDEKERPSVNTR
jgi:transposase